MVGKRPARHARTSLGVTREIPRNSPMCPPDVFDCPVSAILGTRQWLVGSDKK